MKTETKGKLNKSYNVWIIATVLALIVLFVVFALSTIIIDPFMHYHGPLDRYEYPLNNEWYQDKMKAYQNNKERYQNDGIIKNYEYNSIITGTSMVENFKTSEAEKLFNADFIKVPFSGGGYKEIDENIQKAYDVGRNVKYVIRSLDYSMLIQDKDAYNLSVEYPTYLYNNNLLDDVNYILNKEVFLEQTWNVIRYTKKGYRTTNFDNYVNWNDLYKFGQEKVLASYTLGEKNKLIRVLTAEEGAMLLDNIIQNVTELADKHPETTFYLFFPPYSICYWDGLQNDGEVNWRIDAEKIAIEEILKHHNIKLYSFCNNFEMVCNLDNYKDQAHYGEWVNSWMLGWMKEEKYLLTEYNYQTYIDEIRDFYNSYDYSLLRE